MEWTGYVPTFPINKFALVRCNAGSQVCIGGCKHCINVTGSFVAKSCAGDGDHGLNILGMHQDGCKNISDIQNKNYTKWINKSIGKQPNFTLVAYFTQACRCSWDGCNGMPIGVEGSMRSSIASSGTCFSLRKIYPSNSWEIIVITIHLMEVFSFKKNYV